MILLTKFFASTEIIIIEILTNKRLHVEYLDTVVTVFVQLHLLITLTYNNIVNIQILVCQIDLLSMILILLLYVNYIILNMYINLVIVY